MRFPMFKTHGNVESPANAAQVAAGMRALGKRCAERVEARIRAILLGRALDDHPPWSPVPTYTFPAAIQQPQPAATRQEASMYSVVNNIVEAQARLGSDITPGEALDLAGKHYLAVNDGGTTRLFDVDAKNLVDVQPAQQYVPITATITLAP